MFVPHIFTRTDRGLDTKMLVLYIFTRTGSRYIFTSYVGKNTRTDMVLFYHPCHFEYSIDVGNGMYREVTSSDFSSEREKLYRDAIIQIFFF